MLSFRVTTLLLAVTILVLIHDSSTMILLSCSVLLGGAAYIQLNYVMFTSSREFKFSLTFVCDFDRWIRDCSQLILMRTSLMKMFCD
jgi:succinate-acetate transporter protein